jgi:hypothetical protein
MSQVFRRKSGHHWSIGMKPGDFYFLTTSGFIAVLMVNLISMEEIAGVTVSILSLGFTCVGILFGMTIVYLNKTVDWEDEDGEGEEKASVEKANVG